ncbi:hypothetical protein AAKU67_002818 [Oxalobacteraceae bacterium GrIS 2.11]
MKYAMIIMLAGAAIGFTTSASAATAEQKAAYTASTEKADADFKIARSQCDGITGNPKDVCIAEAKAARTITKEQAHAQFEGTAGARVSARKEIAEANFSVAKAKCASKNGNEQDVCVKQAKAVMVAAEADAVADKKVNDARGSANEDKRDADYTVALQKCDALAGNGKDNCVAAAKTQFGK